MKVALAAREPAAARSAHGIDPFRASRQRIKITAPARGTSRNQGFMSIPALPFARFVKHIWVGIAKNLTSWAIVGTIIAVTGFGPEHWFAATFNYFRVPEPA